MHFVAPSRLLFLCSGDSPALQAALDACASEDLRARVVAVISDKTEAYALERARRARVHALAKPKPKAQERRAYDAELADLIASFAPDWIVLADWAPAPTSPLTDRFPAKIIGLHPALPGAFPGSHAVERAYYAYCRGEIERTGVTCYRVTHDAGEEGEVLARAETPLQPDDTLETLAERLDAAQGRLLIRVLQALTAPARSG